MEKTVTTKGNLRDKVSVYAMWINGCITASASSGDLKIRIDQREIRKLLFQFARDVRS